MRQVHDFTVLLLLLFLGGCTSVRVTSTWVAPGTAPRSFQKIAVVGIIREADRTLRQRMENHLVDDLKSRGYPAYSAYDTYGPKAFQDMTEEQVNQQLTQENVDAVLTIVLLDKEKERHYLPGRVVYTPYFIHYNHFWRYYQSLQYRITTPGYYQQSTNYFWESNLYDLSAQKLVYSVQTKAFDPTSADAQAHEYGQKIVQSLVKNQVLADKATPLAKAR